MPLWQAGDCAEGLFKCACGIVFSKPPSCPKIDGNTLAGLWDTVEAFPSLEKAFLGVLISATGDSSGFPRKLVDVEGQFWQGEVGRGKESRAICGDLISSTTLAFVGASFVINAYLIVN